MAAPAPNIPVTVLGSLRYGTGSTAICVGSEYYNPPTSVTPNSYWVFLLDLQNPTQAPVLSETTTNGSAVPAGLAKYLNNPRYLLILNTNALQSDNLPQGDFYKFLTQVGSGPLLNKAEQACTQLGTGIVGNWAYILATTMAVDDALGFEDLTFNDDINLMTFQLMPVYVNNQLVSYTPIQHA